MQTRNVFRHEVARRKGDPIHPDVRLTQHSLTHLRRVVVQEELILVRGHRCSLWRTEAIQIRERENPDNEINSSNKFCKFAQSPKSET